MRIPLGIEIYTSKISDEFYDFLIKEYESVINTQQERNQNHNYFNGCDYLFVNNNNREYIQENLLYHVNEYVGNRDYRLIDQWVNIQAHNDFVPLHEHSGSISYALYLKVPKYLKEEYSKADFDHRGLQYSEGCIEFHYGIKTSLFSPCKRIMPVERQIIMFPSEVLHYVYPYRDLSEPRVSVSGNFIKL